MAVNYSKNKDAVESVPNLDRDDNNAFVQRITSSVISLNRKGIKLTPTNISKESKYNMKEIELNLYEIGVIIDSLGL
jgi:hypothetical protein